MSDFEIVNIDTQNSNNDFEPIVSQEFETELNDSSEVLDFNGENSILKRLMNDFNVSEVGLGDLLQTYFPNYYSKELSLTGNLLQIREYLNAKKASGEQLTWIERTLLNASERANVEVEKTKKEEIAKTLKSSLPYIIAVLLFFLWLAKRKK